MNEVRSEHVVIYRGYTLRQATPATVLIFAIGADMEVDTAISTTWSFDQAEQIIDSWLNAR